MSHPGSEKKRMDWKRATHSSTINVTLDHVTKATGIVKLRGVGHLEVAFNGYPGTLEVTEEKSGPGNYPHCQYTFTPKEPGVTKEQLLDGLD